MEQAASGRLSAGRRTGRKSCAWRDLYAITEHIEVTGREGGLYDEICGLAPHLSGKIDRLRASTR